MKPSLDPMSIRGNKNWKTNYNANWKDLWLG